MNNANHQTNGVSSPTEVDPVLDRLRSKFQSADVKLICPPQLLGGGFWAENWLLRFAPDSQASLPSRLVLRIAPDSQMATWENTIQAGVASLGFPTPSIYAADSARHGYRAWCVMDFADGHPLLAGMKGVRMFATLPWRAKNMSDTLAKAAADLHRLDIATIENDLDKLSFQPIATEGLIDEYLSRVRELPDRSLQLALEALAANRPEVRNRVICHGDLHPFNVLVRNSTFSVIDWTSARIADPAFDLAFSYLLLANPPLDVPGVLRPVVRWIGRRLANRFVASYVKLGTSHIDTRTLEWYISLQAFRILFDLASWRANDLDEARRNHPWFIIEPALHNLVVRTP